MLTAGLAKPTSDLVQKGYLRKNHRGSTLERCARVRYFVSAGFYVRYYNGESMTSCKGRFDLRNVTMLAAANDSAIDDGLVMTIRGKSGPFMVSFRDVSQKAGDWIRLWASAIAPDALDASLKHHRSPALALRFDASYSDQKALRSTFSDKGELFSPREPPSEERLRAMRGLPAAGPACAAPAASAAAPSATAAAVSAAAAAPPAAAAPAGSASGQQLQAVVPQELVAALVAHDWAAAREAAADEGQRGDVAASVLRVQLLEELAAAGEYPKAARLCVTAAEADRYCGSEQQREAERLRWLNYYQTVGSYTNALSLCVSKAEEQRCTATHEERRLAWLHYYTDAGDYSEALALCFTPAEEAVVRAQMAATPGGEGGEGRTYNEELARRVRFAAAVGARDWVEARALAADAEEREDVEMSKERYDQMMRHVAAGERDQALTYAITAAERVLIGA